MKNYVAAALICGDAFKEEEVRKLFESLAPHIYKVFIAYNGTDRKRRQILKSELVRAGLQYKIKDFEWQDNFAIARNQSFEMVLDESLPDWILWIDTDDVLVVEEGTTLDDMIDSLDEYTGGIFLKYNYAIEPETGIVVVEQWRERLLSTSFQWDWKYAIHEVCQSVGNVQYARREGAWIDHQRIDGTERDARKRNRSILEKALMQDPNETRYYFYLAGETMAEADVEEDSKRKEALCDAAIETFETFRQIRNSVDEDVYIATLRLAELNRMKGKYADALNYDMEAVALYPDWPDGYVGAAKSLLEIGDWRRMKGFADIATKLAKPTSPVSLEPLNSTFTPLMLRGIANEELGEFQQALRDYKEALKYWSPPNNNIQERIASLKKHKKESKAKDERVALRGSNPDKSICFFTNPLVETWHPEISKKNGSGGAETCIMELAPKFVENGWRVAVFGTPGEYRGVYNGVEYWDSDEWLPHEPFEIFVSSRSPFPFESKINAKQKYLWMHDVNLGPQLEPYVHLPDKIIALTNWHKQHLSQLYGIPLDKLVVVPNGIDTSKFERSRDNDGSNDPKFIWSSSPDRGLEMLLGMWPVIKDRYPEASLEVYYGWAMIDKIIDGYRKAGQVNHFLEILKERIEMQLVYLGEDSGIDWVGRVPQEQLIDAMYNANFNLYTTDFAETYMLTAVQNQAAGVIPLASNLAALGETVAVKENLLDGWPRNVDYQNRFLQRLHELLNATPDTLKDYRKQGREFALTQSWDNSFNIWNELLATSA